MRTLATIKRIANVSTSEDAAAFFNIYHRGLRYQKVSALGLQAALDHYAFRDHREASNKPFFPLPDEMLLIIKDEEAEIAWKQDAGKRLMEAGRVVTKEALPPPQPHIFDALDRSQTVRAVRLTVWGEMTEQEAYEKVLEEDAETIAK